MLAQALSGPGFERLLFLQERAMQARRRLLWFVMDRSRILLANALMRESIREYQVNGSCGVCL